MALYPHRSAQYNGGAEPRLLIIPGLHDSGPAHWQSWLEQQYRDAHRVRQRDFSQPDLERWSDRIHARIDSAGPGEWIAVAHSFGCLALAHHLQRHPDSPVREALLVAPAEPDKFGLPIGLGLEKDLLEIGSRGVIAHAQLLGRLGQRSPLSQR